MPAIPRRATLLLCLAAGLLPFVATAPASAQHKHAAKHIAHHAPPRTPNPAASPAERDLEKLARGLRESPSGALYEQLSQFAVQHNKTALGARAALALGYYDYGRNHYPEARKWLVQAAADPLLADYALYWQGLDDRALGANDTAEDELRRFRQLYPDSVMSDTAVAALAQAAISANRPEEAIAALDGYPQGNKKASLVLLRAQAQEKSAANSGSAPLAAANSYLDLLYRFPLADEAKVAASKVSFLRLQLSEQFPGTPVENEITRAEVFYDAKRWDDMRAAYQALLPKLSGTPHDLAMLRLAQDSARIAGNPQALVTLTLSDPAMDAQRLYSIAQAQWTPDTAPAMLATVESLVTQYPQSPWTEQALFSAGNYYWSNLDREHGAVYYQRDLVAFPAGPNAATCQWRVAWTSYMSRQAEAPGRLEQFLRQNPTSSYAVDALYWMGRSAEQSGDLPRARGFYRAAQDRFPQTYFAERAGDRLREIGSAPLTSAEVIAVIPPATPLTPFTPALPDAAMTRWTRAQALQSIAFDGSAELELRAAYADTHAPQLLLAVAQAAVAAGRYPAAIMATRQLVPMLESRHFEDLPLDAWRTAYPLPYQDSVTREARRNSADPMLVAGLIRQESAFSSGAVSWTSCCFGLMQVKTSTGARLAHQLKLRFNQARLFDPDYNIQLGTYYIAGLLGSYAAPEYALAAYNAGEIRVAQWTNGQTYQETPEFVESIPFTQTRDYVQIVMRNAELYRRIYGSAETSTPPTLKAAAR